MRIGLMIGAAPIPANSLNELIQLGQRIESLGFNNLWMAHVFEHDAVSALSFIGRETQYE